MNAQARCQVHARKVGDADTWPRGVTASTLDSESSDRGSNPREASGVPMIEETGDPVGQLAEQMREVR